MVEVLIRQPETGAVVEPYGELIDYALVNALDPSLYSFIPKTEELSRLKPGDAVKIGLVKDRDGLHPEHFWVEIAERRGTHGFIGLVQNDLQPGWGVKYGDRLIFCGHHIRTISDSTKMVHHD